jgi:A/G-specific adenine glycosylase
MTRTIADLRAPLLRWYRRSSRDLPWRRTRDPYAIWVAEVMLQQTQVATVLPYYRRFMTRFPDPARLAAASEEEVLALWSGLGYYRRARSLQAAARQVVECHAGRLPADPCELRRLPGIGRYTAGAIASIAFDLCEPVLDGNVRRVLTRIIADDPEERRLWEIAAQLADGPDPGDLNQALMELGALICTPRDPSCDACPLSRHCRAGASGRPEAYPARRNAGRATEQVRVAVAVVRRADQVLLERPPSGSPLRGAWDLPALATPPGATAASTLCRALRRRYGLEISAGEPAGRVSHGIMHRRLRLEVVPCRLRRGRVAGRRELRWVELSALDQAAVSGATHKALSLLVTGPSSAEDRVSRRTRSGRRRAIESAR